MGWTGNYPGPVYPARSGLVQALAADLRRYVSKPCQRGLECREDSFAAHGCGI